MYLYYGKLFEYLQIPYDYYTYTNFILKDQIFYNKYAFLNKNLELINTNIKYASNSLTIHNYETIESITFSIYFNNYQYILLFLLKKENYIFMETLNRNDKNISMGQIKFLFEGALEFINDKLKNQYNLKSIQVMDTLIYKNNTMPNILKDSTNIIPLCDIFMFEKGDTFYGEYGFVPIDHKMNISYETTKKIINIIKIKYTRIKEYLLEYNQNILKRSTVNNIIRKYNNLLLTDFFSYFKKYDPEYEIFGYIFKRIMKDIGIDDLSNIIYCKNI